VPHSNTFVALFSSTCTSDAASSAERNTTGSANLAENREPVTDSLAGSELCSQGNVFCWPKRAGLASFGGFFLFTSDPSSSFLLSNVRPADGKPDDAEDE
jgi:hypothetical protein